MLLVCYKKNINLYFLNMSFINDIFEKYFTKSDKRTKSTTLFHPKNGDPYVKSEDNLEEGYWTHINYITFKNTFEELEKKENKYYTIVETGCSAHGTKSTLLFDKFINYYDGELYSVDINLDRVRDTQQLVSGKTQVVCSDSVLFLNNFKKKIDLAYLDSFDVDWNNQKLSKDHHLEEFKQISDLFKINSLLLIDDTPKNYLWIDLKKTNKNYQKIINIIKGSKFNGKGAYIYPYLIDNWSLIQHQYQMLWKCKSITSSIFSL